MQLSHFLLTTVSLYGLGSSFPTLLHGLAQQPLVHKEAPHPNDNLTLTPIRDALVSNKVIGDVLNDFEPSYYIDLIYPKSSVHVFLGNEIAVDDLKKRPKFRILPIPNKRAAHTVAPTTFTLVLTDPDAKSRYDPIWSEMCHWIVTNITISTKTGDLTKDGIELDMEEDYAFQFQPDEDSWFNKYTSDPPQCKRDGKGSKCLPGELESYLPPGPPAATGWHRYVFVLLAGDATELQAPTARKHWGYGRQRHGVRDWANAYGLEVVGANFFFAENEQQ